MDTPQLRQDPNQLLLQKLYHSSFLKALEPEESAEPAATDTQVRQEHRLSEWQGVQAGSSAGGPTHEVSCEKTSKGWKDWLYSHLDYRGLCSYLGTERRPKMLRLLGAGCLGSGWGGLVDLSG